MDVPEGLQPDIVVFSGHGNGRIRIASIGMFHMDHYNGELWGTFSQQSGLSGMGTSVK